MNKVVCAFLSCLVLGSIPLFAGDVVVPPNEIERCFTSADCPDQSFCSIRDGCEGEGFCTPRVLPEACDNSFTPVCGCDGQTYANACFANAEGASVAYHGACVTPNVCVSSEQCEPDFFCRSEACGSPGVCAPRPVECPQNFTPVCGCDGRTYPNACTAAKAGVGIASPGACGEVVCSSNESCARDEYCNKPGCDNVPGVCSAKPEVCPRIFEPVCGCDGRTYGNRCEAARGGVNVAAEGACPNPNRCQSSADCPDDGLCAKRLGDCGGEGFCVDKPKLCPAIYDPVCGCDGVTYGNKCQASRAGVNVASEGVCPDDPRCSSNLECTGIDFCSKREGDCEGAGVCTPRPAACPRIFDPVCGCDGQTYENSCVAAARGVNVAHPGSCDTRCRNNQDCSSNEFCERPACGEVGLCQPRGDGGCPEIYDPVCGCDGVTYENRCFARAAGVSIQSEGACEPPVEDCSSNADCSERNQYCRKRAGDCEGAGLCMPMPDLCPDVFAPVCGCDGNTYGNACEAAARGVNIAHEGACNEPERCRANSDCSDAEFCAKDGGDCRGAGVCKPRPELCPDVFAPVCGCDGNTYGNACRAAAGGVNVAHPGPCEPLACQNNDPCSPNEFCSKEAGNCPGEGVCRPRPDLCTREYNPVCGCDGMTYGNACQAAAAGVNVAAQGECPISLCSTNAECGDGQLCAHAIGDCDGPGLCAARPTQCPDVFEPVCGCDGNTYGNACRAYASGASVAHIGPCELPRCENNDSCGDGEFCQRAGCDGAGVCKPRPQACPDVFDPVCGCDGQTYGNRCEAAARGVNVSHAGACQSVCRHNADCSDAEFCSTAEGSCEGEGICRPRPQVCPDVFAPVCGCDGNTYGNACEGAAAGVSVSTQGPCPDPGICLSDDDCARGQFCTRLDGDCDGIGFCRPRPTQCPDVFDPVCGCDGQSYGNACRAAAAGVSVAHPGTCQTDDCRENGQCDRSQWCAKPDGACDGGGVCRVRPTACPDVFAPVCGCDGTTYGNECEAAANGVNIAHDGPCQPPACTSNADCDRASFCALPECGSPGFCRPRPQDCPAVFDPVCGCDGRTYANKCRAAGNGVSVAHEGECPPPTCKTNLDCAGKTYCAKPGGECESEGVCRMRPDVCDGSFEPVCGCDGNTYANTCLAAVHGVNVAHKGRCQNTCETNEDCPGGFCAREPGVCDGPGVCRPRPDACPDGWEPVCGCDNQTYANACKAAAAGVNIAGKGACGLPTCLKNEDCGPEAYCAQAPGVCGEGGHCRPRPEACTREFNPVCGCDGRTYSNPCLAAAKGANIAHRGPCEPPPCRTNDDCGTGAYCMSPTGDCDGPGMCVKRPDICTREFDPVCGCDGNTYANKCMAARQGVGVAHEGACVEPPDRCRSNRDCGDREFCSKERCGDEGICRPRPEVCPDVVDPVCGCDGKSYINKCVAAAHGVSVAHAGRCKPAECRTNGDCPDTEFCFGSCDGPGICRTQPTLCTREFAPVCGCDGRTYPNTCTAAAAGVNVAHPGQCVPTTCTENDECPDSGFCRKAPGDCEGEGHCSRRPQACPDIFDPVCGCDSVTYANECDAAAAGVNVQHRGACADRPCQTNDDCPRGYCQHPTGACNAPGVCRPYPGGPVVDPIPVCALGVEPGPCRAAIPRWYFSSDSGQCERFIYGGCGGNDNNFATQAACEDRCSIPPCAQPKVPGPCRGSFPRWYYNSDSGVCERFIYGGCGGNDNNFLTRAECERGCSVPVCTLDKEVGPCEAAIPRFYYNQNTGSCEAFTYGGCGGNANNFATLDACEASCENTVPPCALPKVVGPCDAVIPRWYFNSDSGVCERFVYGGCGGNANNFETLAACEDRCDETPVCALPKVVGPCKAAIPRWYYNSDSGMCERFIYGGCGGNRNNFQTLAACEESCKPRDVCPEIFAPVCGCDGKTYGNECLAAVAGVSIDHKGRCEPQPCRSNRDCEKGTYCEKDGCEGAGVCEKRPTICTREFNPVCGCDGHTYGNACQAAAAGVNVAHPGACQPFGCTSDDQCGEGEYCSKEPGDCDGVGVCRGRPLCFSDHWDPVCGCDGVTYNNDCIAASAGVNVAHEGECDPPTCLRNEQCDANEYCAKRECGGEGVCRERPVACPRVFDPVCGCNGQTYANACEAAAAGVSFAHNGICRQICTPNTACPQGTFCSRPGCESPIGLCQPIPSACPEIFDPVCGCDGSTYVNACEAAANSASIAHRGPCQNTCNDNQDCSANEFCARGLGDCDGDGMCALRPEVCPAVFDPVCGCDDTTYGNACEAAAAGVNVAHRGECRPVDLCKSDENCGPNQYCVKEPGDCEGLGVCRDIPGQTICPRIFDPVCGCDGNTYANRCEAARAGANIAHEGECVRVCTSNAQCGDDQYCALETCDGEGLCRPRPNACPDVWDPVCGCDGRTYANACDAAAAGVSISHRGECQSMGCQSNEQCGDHEWCKKEACGGSGECSQRPDICPAIFAPVCGCDGETYGNACRAAAAGVNVRHEGVCDPPPTCLDNRDCPATSYCAKDGCHDGPGLCRARPTACPDVFDPVCGCDGRTYGNKCEAAARGVNVAHEGACENTCLDQSDCARDEYCAKSACHDGPGVCAPRPDACPEIFDPVCGCDGRTYGNRCEAAHAGVNVLHEGVCKPEDCRNNRDCPDDAYCQKDLGACEGAGVCAPRSAACPEIFDPVCGCDGRTYANRCFAAARGVNVSHEGACTPPTCSSNVDCPDGFCAKAAGDCDGEGACRPRPDACPDVFDPVCGCDGRTYGNTCDAAANGVNVAHEGACETPGCTDDSDCNNGLYCAKAPGDCDGEGVCSARPLCLSNHWDPVCGCDGITYNNACIAASAGANMAHDGVCISFCQQNDDCADNEFCQTKAGDCDGPGQCRERPIACPDVWNPVCGCDKQTYANACDAAAAGASIGHRGTCEPAGCTSNAECPNGYCAKEPGNCEGQGVCRPTPDLCPAVFDPVCGCDGQTYGNACRAAAAGVNVAHEGACEAPRCERNEQCEPREFCAKEAGDCGGPGMCRARPEVCPDVFDPVCGCDGRTYGNRCEAAAAGVNIAHQGECQPSACRSNDDCGRDEICRKASGECRGEGVCRPRPDACPDVFDPVCGCDGQTYANACKAAVVGVNVAHKGSCDMPTCLNNADCSDAQYCKKDGCHDGPGVCEVRPAGCFQVFQPVCGCDGRTYGNGCEAAAAGVNVAHDGACEPTTCSSNDDCPNGYCQHADGDCDGPGRCTAPPERCPLIFAPVCGCDGVTYGNACLAARARTSVAHEGPCETNTCDSNDDCSDDQFCQRDGDCDGPGVCAERPSICPLLFVAIPTCGCDGVTYGQPCEAHLNGVSVAHDGACVDPVCRTNDDCGNSQFCRKACEDEEGVCADRPIGCPRIFDPVCGCDGETYANACEAAAAGVNVGHEGACQPNTCRTNDDCRRDEFCHTPDGQCGVVQVAGGVEPGVCRVRPTDCPPEFAPVCGCDGRTYAGHCDAARAGVSVRSVGTCHEVACCLPDGSGCQYLSRSACIERGGLPQPAGQLCSESCRASKWMQPPVLNPNGDSSCYLGWDERSNYDGPVVADDWFCQDARPISAVTWWGSYLGWQGNAIPEVLPEAWHIGLWSSVPPGVDKPFGHPGELMVDWTVAAGAVQIQPDGCDQHPALNTTENVYRYVWDIPPADRYTPPSGAAVYWLSISPIYSDAAVPPPQHPWGWLTRPLFFNAGSVGVTEPATPIVGQQFLDGFPVVRNERPWDLAFALLAETSGGQDFGNDDTHHDIVPGLWLGEGVDGEDSGEPGDEDDGVEFVSPITVGTQACIRVTAGPLGGVLDAWIDLNGNDTFDLNEHLFGGTGIPVHPGVNEICVPIPEFGELGAHDIRFRLSANGTSGPTGAGGGGEVEDYGIDVTQRRPSEKPRIKRLRPRVFGNMNEVEWEGEDTGTYQLEGARNINGPWFPVGSWVRGNKAMADDGGEELLYYRLNMPHVAPE